MVMMMMMEVLVSVVLSIAVSFVGKQSIRFCAKANRRSRPCDGRR